MSGKVARAKIKARRIRKDNMKESNKTTGGKTESKYINYICYGCLMWCKCGILKECSFPPNVCLGQFDAVVKPEWKRE